MPLEPHKIIASLLALASLASLASLATVWPLRAAAQSLTPAYPIKPVRVICPFPAGGGLDILPRAMLAKMGEAPFLLVSHPSLNARNVRELIALAKRRPGELNYGSPGVGGTNHLGAELFSQSAGIRMTHVVFKGSQPMLVDIMGGHVMMGFDSLQATLPHIKSGRLRALGESGTHGQFADRVNSV